LFYIPVLFEYNTSLIVVNFLQGEGTREGTGKCNCDNGYEGDLCDECKDGFFEESKNDTHTKCTGMRKTSWVEMEKYRNPLVAEEESKCTLCVLLL
jgi:hypothetical protein